MKLRNTYTVARRDFRTYFTSPIAYIVIAGFMGIMGWMFYNNLAYFMMQNLQYQQFNMGKGGNINENIIRPLYGNMNVIFLLLIPFITMRLFAEERKQHTLELLMTSPITLTEIILGKFCAAWALGGIMLLITGIYPLILRLVGNPDMGPVLTANIGMFLIVGCYVAIGTLFSAMTENQIVAGALTFAVGLFFWLVSWASQSAGPVWGEFFNYMSIISHYNNFGQGLLNTSDILYYVSFIGIGLFLTHRVLDSYRWR